MANARLPSTSVIGPSVPVSGTRLSDCLCGVDVCIRQDEPAKGLPDWPGQASR